MSSIPAASHASNRIPYQAYLVIAMGVIGISLGSTFIKIAQNEHIPSLLIAAARMTIASLIITPIALRRHRNELRKLTRNELILAGISGLFLAIHFATWILSFEYTSVLVSVVLVNTNPLWVALLEVFFLHARLARWMYIALLVGIVGSAIVAIPPDVMANGVSTLSLGNSPLVGSLLALTGAVAVAVYYIIGRKLRARLPLLPYIWLVYGCAALVLLVVVLLMRITITGYSLKGYLALAGMALIPQLVGHSSLNYALKYFAATYVGIAAQLEPVLSGIIAFFIFQETPLGFQIIGSAVVLGGVVLASLGQTRPAQSEPSSPAGQIANNQSS